MAKPAASFGAVGGGISAFGEVNVAYSTIAQNHAVQSKGGGIWLRDDPITIIGSIVAGNRAPAGNPDLQPFLEPVTMSFSLLGDSAGTTLVEATLGSPDANGNIVGGPVNGAIDPLLGPLVFNGGHILPDGQAMLTHALLPGSPAIDAGDPAAVAGMGEVPLHDQRGVQFSRVANGDDITEARVDIGAFEWQPNPLQGDYNYSGAVDAADYVVWRKTVGSSEDLRADGDGDADGDQDDYAVWRANFGRTSAVPITGAAAAASWKPPASPSVSAVAGNPTTSAGNHDSVANPAADRWAVGPNGSSSRRSSAVPRRASAETNADNDFALVAWLAAIDYGVTTSQSSATVDSITDERSRTPDGPSADAVDDVFATLGVRAL